MGVHWKLESGNLISKISGGEHCAMRWIGAYRIKKRSKWYFFFIYISCATQLQLAKVLIVLPLFQIP